MQSEYAFPRSLIYVSCGIGFAVDLAQPPPRELLDSGMTPSEFLTLCAARLQALDPNEFPFAHQVADEMAGHDDRDIFQSGLNLLLAGLRLQAGASKAGCPDGRSSTPPATGHRT